MSKGEKSGSSENRMLTRAMVGGIAVLGCLTVGELAATNRGAVEQFVIEQMVPLIAPPTPYLNEQLSGIDIDTSNAQPAPVVVPTEVGLHSAVLLVPGK